MKLTGKVIAITGGFGNLGVALGAAAAAAGAQVALIGRSAAPPARDLPRELTGALLLGNVDVTSFEAAREAFATIVRRCTGLDVLVNGAGGFRWQTLADGDLETWDALYSVNLKTAVVASKAALPHLLARGGGRIINVGAAASITAGKGMGAYAAAKAGVARLTESLAAEMKDHGINVNAVLPGIIDTPANRADMPQADFSRWVAPAALADVIVFLASDGARAITGALLPVSGRL
ncbi:MAG TPA: SDR family NAD(P)-dependent oxidoreductase [Steroidobacteraceae bacterium]|nr:SDR family NAD(P)-dependent oxidoreductase [Steroidobacteraceae bacterium]